MRAMETAANLADLEKYLLGCHKAAEQASKEKIQFADWIRAVNNAREYIIWRETLEEQLNKLEEDEEEMNRDEFMIKAKDEIDKAFSGQKNRMMNLVEQAWAEGKRNAEQLDEITNIVKEALDRARPSYPATPSWPDPVSPWINPVITNNTSKDKPPEAHYSNGTVEDGPHQTSIVICTNCGQKWVAIRPLATQNAALECPQCHLQGTAVETGLPLDPGVTGEGDGK